MDIFLPLLKFINPIMWIEKGMKYFKRPILVSYYDPKETYRTRLIANQNNTPGYFCHIMVKNDGKDVAKNCRGRIINIQVENDNGLFEKHEFFSAPMVLKWAHESDFKPKEIEPDIPRRLDLCYGMQTHPDSLIIFTDHKPDGNLKIYPPGKYRITIRIDSENAKTTDRDFIVNFNGSWNQIEMSDVKIA